MIAIEHALVKEEKKEQALLRRASYTDHLQSPADGVTPKGWRQKSKGRWSPYQELEDETTVNALLPLLLGELDTIGWNGVYGRVESRKQLLIMSLVSTESPWQPLYRPCKRRLKAKITSMSISRMNYPSAIQWLTGNQSTRSLRLRK